jgi:hypothetical protein
LAGAALLLVPAPAPAARKVIRVTTSAQGDVVVSWHGDPAAGCADRGTCAFSGTYELPVGGGGVESDEVSGNATLPREIQLDSGQPTVVRARRDAPDGPGLCVDVVSSDLSGISIVRVPGGRLALQTAGLQGASGPLAGRCAGPLFSDLPARFPSIRVPGRVGSKPVTLDFSGRRAFSAGGWSGEVTSTVKVTLSVTRHARHSRLPIPYPIATLEPPKPRNLQVVTLEYRAQQLAAGVGVAFHGLADPACEPFDACGTSGTASWSIGGLGRTDRVGGTAAAQPVAKGPLIVLTAQRRLRPREPRDLASALRALREGRMDVTGNGDLGAGRAQNAEQLPGGGSCSDSTPAVAPSLFVATRRGRVSFGLGGPQGLSTELFRTRCPGPVLADAFGQGGALVVGRVPERALAARTLRVEGQSAGGFSGKGYLGSRRTTLLLVLRRVRARVEPMGTGAP